MYSYLIRYYPGAIGFMEEDEDVAVVIANTSKEAWSIFVGVYPGLDWNHYAAIRYGAMNVMDFINHIM